MTESEEELKSLLRKVKKDMSLCIFMLIKAFMIILMSICQKNSLNIFVNFSSNHCLSFASYQ